MSTYTIGQIAERTGFTTSALRFYEQRGLLEPVGRSEAGYRIYDDASLVRLGFIDRAKQLGCTLEEIADLAELWQADACGPVQARLHELVTAKITDARRRSGELLRFTAQLRTAAAHLGGDPIDGPCRAGCACMAAPPESAGSASAPLAPRQDPAIACTLPVGEMPDRLEAWQAVLAHATGRERTPDGGVRVSLDARVPLDELARLAAAEQGCCAFLALAITIDHRGIALEVHAPEAADDIVTAVFGSAARAVGPSAGESAGRSSAGSSGAGRTGVRDRSSADGPTAPGCWNRLVTE